MDADGNIIKSWNSTGMEQTIEGLAAGEYKLIVSGNRENGLSILVRDQAELQAFYVERWTTTDIAALAGAFAVCSGLVILLLWLLANRKRKKESEE